MPDSTNTRQILVTPPVAAVSGEGLGRPVSGSPDKLEKIRILASNPEIQIFKLTLGGEGDSITLETNLPSKLRLTNRSLKQSTSPCALVATLAHILFAE